MKKTAVVLSCLLIAALCVIAYANALGGKFVWDDYILIKNNPYISKWSYAVKALTENINAGQQAIGFSYRPTQLIIYIALNSVWGQNELPYHALNLLVHIIVALLIFWLINILFRDIRLSLITCLLYAVSPLHTSAVAYISGLADPLAAAFILLALILYIRNVDKGNFFVSLLSSLLYLLAIMSKEYALILLAVIFLYHYIFEKKVRFAQIIPLAAAAILYIVFRFTVLANITPHSPYETTIFQRMPGFLVAIAGYTRLLILPINLHVEYGRKLFALSDPMAILGAIILISALACAFLSGRKNKIISFSILWFFLLLLPQSNLYPLHYYMAEHWLYLPSAGFFLMIAAGIVYLYEKKAFRITAVLLTVMIVSIYTYLTIAQNHYWKDPLAFYLRSVKYSPDNPNLYNDLGNTYMETGNNEEAIRLYKRAVELAPNQLHTYNNLALAYKNTGRYDKAIDISKKLLAVKPDYAKAYNTLGSLYKLKGSDDEAIAMYKKAIELKADYSEPYNNLAIIYEMQGKHDDAVALFEKAADIFPGQFALYYNMGMVYAATHKYDDALAAFKKALELNPGDKGSYNNMANVLKELGRKEEAVAAYKKALEIDPKFAIAYKNLAIIYYDERKYDKAIESYDRALQLGFPPEEGLIRALEPFRKKEDK